MRPAAAIKKFMGTQGFNPDMTYYPVKISEVKEFKTVCTSEEWNEFGRHACEAMGEEFENA